MTEIPPPPGSLTPSSRLRIPRIRVLHITARSDHGGGPEHIRQVIAAETPGVSHFVACPSNGVYWDRYGELVGDNKRVAIPHRRVSVPAMIRLTQFIRNNRIEVIHSHGMGAGVYGRTVALLTGVPIIHSFHGVPVTPGLKHRLYHLVEHIMALCTDQGVAVSEGEADLVRRRWGQYRHRLAVVVNGIEPSQVPTWASWPPKSPLRIVSFTRRNQQKFPEVLIEVARCLRLMGIQFHLDAYGEGLNHPALLASVAALDLARSITFHSAVDDPAIALQGGHVYLSTSRWEGMPLAILEAWHAGLAVVASNVVGNQDLINAERGFLYPVGNGRAAARIIRDLIADPVTVNIIRANALEVVTREHSSELMALRLTSMYHQLAHHRDAATSPFLQMIPETPNNA